MKIGFFVWEYPPSLVGGLGTYAEYITREYVKMGHDVSVFTLNRDDSPEYEVMKGVEVFRPKIIDATKIFPLIVSEDLKRWGTAIKMFADVFTYNIASANLMKHELMEAKSYKYDIVAGHDWLGAPAGVIIKNNTSLPFVFHVHSTEWGRSGGGGSQVVTQLEEIARDESDRIITVSNAMRDDLAQHGWPESKISVVWNGVDPDLYDPDKYPKAESDAIRAKYGIKDTDIMLLFVGRLTWVKGVRNLIQAMPTILKDHPNVKLVVLGKGEEQKDLTELATRLGVQNNVIYRFDFVEERERILHYAAADLCIFPSVYEPFGIVSLEAMSMKKPVVVGARGVVGFREQVIPSGPERCGYHVNGNDPNDIAWAVGQALANPDELKAMGENGRKRVLQYFTWSAVAKQTLAIYEEVAKKRRRTAARGKA